MLGTWLRGNLPLASLAWGILYTSDYSLSVIGSRMYHAGVQEVLVHGGGIQLTPQFRRDIEDRRWSSPRWLANLLITVSLLSAVWFVVRAAYGGLWPFDLVVGGPLLPELAIHTWHPRLLAP